MRPAKRLTGRALAILLALALSLMLLTAVTCGMGTSPQLMQQLMQRYAPPEATGLPAEDYPAMAEMITGYLRGAAEEFQYVYTLDGSEYLAFHDYEQQHMRDVLGLFRLCCSAAVGSLLAAALLLWAGLLLMEGKRFARWVQYGLLAVLAVVTALAVWAAIDFDSLFILFHRAAFTNDLWLLDPRTDMLIRLMPTAFFVTYAAAIAGAWLLLMLAALILSELLRRFGGALVKSIMNKGR